MTFLHPDRLAPGTNLSIASDPKTLSFGVDGPHVARSGAAGVTALTSISGLSWWHHKKAVNMTLQAAVLCLHNSAKINYTQGPERWQGIDRGYKAWRGQFPNEADCSSFYTWCLWQGLDHFHIGDIVNGCHWKEGYTGTLLTHGRSVSSPLPGDAVIYGTSWPGEHVALYTGGGLVVSHGGPGVHLLPWKYRSDVLSIRRYL